MTHSGGKPHTNVGDRGQRYAVTYYDDGVLKTFGWSNSLDGADRMCKSIDLNPSMSKPMIFDREQKSQVDRP